ncbi:MAG: tyrosine-protein phosphatase [Prevotella sp.]|jgi:protein-tyrosine phosphatase|nr:tyrosine-protein phosphatase [Prevotella sp.]
MNKIFIYMTVATVFLVSCGKQSNLKAGYTGEDISKDAKIIRDKTSKVASLQIQIKGEWALYEGSSVDNIDFSRPIASGSEPGTFPLDISDSVRSYFELVSQRGTAILSEQHLPMTGGYNFRDLGGYKTSDDKYVKWGKIFRSDDLHNLTEADLDYLASIPLISIVDFRSKEEMNQAPDKNPSSVKTNYSYSISPGNLMAAASSLDDLAKLTANQADTLMIGMNILLVTDSACVQQYRNLFQLLQNDTDTPLMFHCSAGKDRTGMAAALILSALGVDERTILNDYLLSNIYLADKYAKCKDESPALKSLFEVKTEFLQAGLDRIKEDHGSIENYLTKVLNVDIQKMKQKYLY